MRACILALAVVAAGPALAESSLGIAGADVVVGALQDEDGSVQSQTRITADVAVTTAHGLQGDLAFQGTAHGTIGRLTAHLYMDPNPGSKYGLFFAMSDVDGRSLAWATAGIETQIQLTDTLLFSGRTGLGQSNHGGLDYIVGGVSLARAITEEFEIEATFDVAEFDEADFRALSVETGLTAAYSPTGRPWGVYAEAAYSDLAGRDGTEGAARLGLGLTFAFGNAGGVDTETRPFRDHDAVAALVRRGLR